MGALAAGVRYRMPLYRFKISDTSGKISELLVEGDSQTDATRRLQNRGMMPLEFLGEGTGASGGKVLHGLRSRFDVVDFTDRLVPLLEANIALERALGIAAEGLDDAFTAKTIGELRRGLHEGRKFSDLIRDRGRLFPNLYSSVIEAGEEAGALPLVMAELRRFLNDRRELRAFLASASVYPCFILTAGFVMLGIVIGVIVPRFATVLAGATATPSSATELLLGISQFARSYWWLIPVALVLFAILLLQLRREGRVRALFDEWILKVPILGKMVLYSNLARMARTMSILMRSGVHLLDTVSIGTRVIQNRTLSQSISGLSGELRQGQRLSAALGHSRHVPSFMLRMLAVGEETGEVDKMLERVAERYEEDLRRNIKRLLSLFEPLVIVFLGLFVAGIVLLMFLAIMDLQSGI